LHIRRAYQPLYFESDLCIVDHKSNQCQKTNTELTSFAYLSLYLFGLSRRSLARELKKAEQIWKKGRKLKWDQATPPSTLCRAKGAGVRVSFASSMDGPKYIPSPISQAYFWKRGGMLAALLFLIRAV